MNAGQPNAIARELENLLLVSPDAYPHSVSSRAWHSGPVYLNKDQRTLYMMIASGRDLVLGLETGAYAYCEPRAGQYLCRNSNSDRVWRPYSDAVPR